MLKQKIKDKGLKIVWIAEKIGISQPLLSMYLNGTRQMPEEIKRSIEKLIK